MPCYKVVHFNGRGYAEPTRMLLALVGQEFEDVRHSTADWPKLKADVPLQQLPYMEVDGKIIPQSRAMHGFVAREFGLNGANNEETTQIDVVLSTLEDIRVPLGRILYYEKELDEIQKKEKLKEFYEKTAPKYMAGLEKMLTDNNGGHGFFVGSKISRADIFFYVVMETVEEDELKKYPKLSALMKRVAEAPKIAAYLAKRPQTPW
ncbi:glutathione S-transferase-like isoform X1 [Patiria miniata]|nr:glutathione S-transferase-like isoform X1 [Patiria miniata]